MDTLATALPWIKFLHLCALLLWCATLFALPALLALHPTVRGRVARLRLRAATRFVYIAVASPAAVAAVASGTLLIHPTASYEGWLLAKLTLVTGMVFFHAACGKLVLVLRETPRRWREGSLLSLGLLPLLLVAGVLWLVLAQPVLPLPGLAEGFSLPRPR